MMYKYSKKVMDNSQDKMKTYYDKKRKADPLKLGDMVYVSHPRMKRTKLQPNWRGPFNVINKSEHLYQILITKDDNSTIQWLPRDRLCRCYSKIVPRHDRRGEKS